MYDNSKGDLRINGSGSASGGTFESVRINGSGRINGDIVCRELTINGSGETTGKLEGEKVKISGSGTIRGSLKANELKVSGSATFDDMVAGGEISVSGSADFKKNLDAKTIGIRGSAKIDGDCSAERFLSEGVFEIGGLLNADDIRISLYWRKSRAREIGGENINVRLGLNKLGVFTSILSLGILEPCLEADLIEGNDITLENTKAKVVRGNNVVIGGGCDIELVEYRGTLRKSDGSSVKKEEKI